MGLRFLLTHHGQYLTHFIVLRKLNASVEEPRLKAIPSPAVNLGAFIKLISSMIVIILNVKIVYESCWRGTEYYIYNIVVKGPVSAMSVCKLTPMYNLSNTLLVGLSMEQIDTVQ